jgi:membrane protein required for colicin V production
VASLGTVDWILLGILALSVLIGLWRGLVFEVLSLLGWVVAYFAAQWFAPQMSAHLPVGAPGGAINHAAGFAVTFILVLVLWALAARLIKMLITASPLSALDRMLGAVFGLLRGLVLLLAIATVVWMTPAARSPAWSESRGAAWLHAMLQGLKPVLPVEVAQHLPA